MKKTQAQAQAQAQVQVQVQEQVQELVFEKASKPTPFLQGKYFRGLAELFYLCETKEQFYPTIDVELSEQEKKVMTTEGIILSVHGRDIIELARKDLGFYCQNFNFNNKYFYDTKGEVKTDNINAFNKVLEDIKANGLQVFSYSPISGNEWQELEKKYQKEKERAVSSLINF